LREPFKKIERIFGANFEFCIMRDHFSFLFVLAGSGLRVAAERVVIGAPSLQVLEGAEAEAKKREWQEAATERGAAEIDYSFFDGCRYLFLDVGSNIGLHARFFFEPEKFPKQEYERRVFSKYFPQARHQRNDSCR
jgi:hypothetical protein